MTGTFFNHAIPVGGPRELKKNLTDHDREL